MGKGKRARRTVKLLLISIVSILCILVNVQKTEAATSTNMKIHAINLTSHGDAVLIESEGKYILMDMGTYSDYSTIKDYLHSLGIKHLSLYYSHFDPDHTGGLGKDGQFGIDNLMKDFTVDKVYVPDPSISPKGNLQTYVDRVTQHYANQYSTSAATTNVIRLVVGSTFSIGDANFNIIGPVGVSKLTADSASDSDDDGNYINNCSLIARITCGTTSYLSTGDCKTEEENQLIKKYGAALKADIYKMSHHGLAPANSEKLLSYIKPTYSFAQNAGFTENVKYSDGTRKHRRTYPSRYACSLYGFCYMVGDEKKTLVIDVTNNKVSLNKKNSDNSLSKLNKPGWTKVYGSDGDYEKYDYYYFGIDGKPLTGVQKISGVTYYLGTGGCRGAGTNVVDKGKKVYRGWNYYKDSSGKQTRRYFDKKTDAMYTGFHWVDKKYYYFDSKGILRTGDSKGTKQKIKGKYYAIYTGGSICTNSWRKYSKGSCYFDKKGRMLTGWATINKKKYYMDTKTGYRLTGLKTIGSKMYLFSSYGQLQTNRWNKVGSNYMFLSKSGVVVTGWMTYKGYKYYMDPDTRYRTCGIRQIGTKVYYFNEWGMLNANTVITVDKKNYSVDGDGMLQGVTKVSAVKLKSVAAGSKKATAKWKRNRKADGYVVYVSTSKKGDYKIAETVTSNKTTATIIKKLKKGKTYYVKVVAYKNFGGTKVYASDSNVVKVKVK